MRKFSFSSICELCEKVFTRSFDTSKNMLSHWHNFLKEMSTFAKMKSTHAYRLILCALALLLAAASLPAQEREAMPGTALSGKSGYLGYRVEGRDTVYYDSINPVWVFPKGHKGKKGDLRNYYKLVYNFNKVYPYALVAKGLTQEVDDHIAANSLRRGKKEKYINQMQKELFSIYEKPLRNMTVSQGKLLIRLIDREIGRSSYKIIRDYKNAITAGFWQGIAKIFGNDLKSPYDAEGEDRMTEYLVEKWERGEFDELYFSIFWEMPKHPVVKSNRIQFED